MTVVRKPQPHPQPEISEAEKRKLINAGGSVAGERKKQNAKKHYPLSLPQHFYDKIIKLIERRPYKVPVNSWLLEAIDEKIKREENASPL